ncbi:MAG: DUF6443 domain-containing protein, partial [Bacteroidota bacterium]
QKIKIEVDWNAATWKITTAAGMIYHFGGPAATEITTNTNTCGDFGSTGHISSWLLNKIEGPNGDEVTFTYQSDGLIANTPQVSVTKYRPQIPGDDCSGKTPTSCTSTTFHNSLRPVKIESAFGRIEFIYATQTRQDIPTSRALERIEIWDSYNVRKKYFDLTQSYWSGRLLLDGVSEHGDLNTRKPAYLFTYDKSGLLPPQGSFSQDHWGFYNGKQNSELIPRTEISACVFVGSADRSPDFNYGKIGTLTNIQYPAGGSTTFQYEPHDQWAGPQNFAKIDDNSSISLSCAGGPNCGGGPTSQTQPFVIDHDQCVTINVNLSNPVQATGDCEAKVRLWTSTGTLVEEFTCVNQANGQHQRFLTAGNYYLEALVQLQGDAVLSGVFFQKQLAAPILNKQLGGLRVARITDHDAFDPANDIVREFVYRLENVPQRSSGIMARAPRYLSTNEEAIAINNAGGGSQNGTIYQYCTRIGVGSSNLAGGPATGGSHIGYREVTTLIGAGGSNGKTVSRFTNADGFPDSQSAFPGGPGVSWDHRRGMLESQTTYDNTGKKVMETVNEYAYATDNHTIVRGYSAGFQRKHPVNTGAPYEILVYQPHEVHSEWVYMSRSVAKQFDENGVDFLATTTDYEYGNPAHAQVTATRSTDSHGRELITRMQFPLDFAGGSGPYARALNKLANGKFMHAVPVEQTMSQKKPGQNERVLQSYLWLFKEFTVDHPLPEKLLFLETDQPISNFQPASVNQNLQYDSRYAFRETVEKVNDYGQVMQILQKDGIRAAYKWGYDQTLPIAQVLNGETSIIGNQLNATTAFCGFESGQESIWNINEDFWVFSPQNDHTPTAHTGRYAREIQSGTQVAGPTREIIPSEQNTSYTFSVWANTPSNYAGGSLIMHTRDGIGNSGVWPPSNLYNSFISVPIPATNGQWQRIEATLELGKLRQQANIAPGQNLRVRAYVLNSDPNNKLIVDDLRLLPENARMTTYTYDPIAGQTSASDVNDIATYFRYDPLLRLDMVRDRHDNIVRKVQYDYKGLNGATQNAIHDNVVQIKTQSEAQISQLNIGDKYRTIQYVDGFGRQLQTISVGSGPQNEDVVSFSDYDQFGRAPKQWLPYARTGQNGAFVQNPESEQSNFYLYAPRVADSNFPYAETGFDHSPLNRPKEQGAPGADWQLGNG